MRFDPHGAVRQPFAPAVGQRERKGAAVADIVLALGRVLAGTPAIREIDLNPVVVYPQGQGAVALDALILADG